MILFTGSLQLRGHWRRDCSESLSHDGIVDEQHHRLASVVDRTTYYVECNPTVVDGENRDSRQPGTMFLF